MRAPAGDVVDRAVPAVDRAVVQPQLLQLRRAAALEHGHRVLVLDHGQQRREVADVLLEEVEDRRDPALAEPHARAHALGLELLRARVGGLLEERDPRLAPQLAPEEERRVGADRHLDAGDRLRRVPVRAEPRRVDHLVQLHARARRLGGDRVGHDREPLDAGDVDLQVLPAGREDLLVEQLVARVGRQRVAVEQLLGERREDPDDHHVRVGLRGLLLGVVEVAPDRLLELGEHRPLELARRDVDLDVELRELGLEVVVGDQLEHVRVGQRRVAGLLGQVELDLQADRAPVGIEARLREHPREDVQAQLDLVAVALAVLAAEGGIGDFIAHGAPFPGGACSVSATEIWCHGRARPEAAAGDLRVVRRDRHARRARRRRARSPSSTSSRSTTDGKVLDGAPVRGAPRRRAGRLAAAARGGATARGTRSGSSPRSACEDATITAQGITLGHGQTDDAVFHVLVPARHWWDDIGFT